MIQVKSESSRNQRVTCFAWATWCYLVKHLWTHPLGLFYITSLSHAKIFQPLLLGWDEDMATGDWVFIFISLAPILYSYSLTFLTVRNISSSYFYNNLDITHIGYEWNIFPRFLTSLASFSVLLQPLCLRELCTTLRL